MVKKKRSLPKTRLIVLLLIAITIGIIYTQLNTWSNTNKNDKKQGEDQMVYDAIKAECDAAYQSQVNRGIRPVRYPCEDADIQAIFVQRYSREPIL